MSAQTKPSYTTTYKAGAGWKAVLIWWNAEDGGFYEPWATGHFAWSAEEQAIADAKYWAESNSIEYRPRKS